MPANSSVEIHDNGNHLLAGVAGPPVQPAQGVFKNVNIDTAGVGSTCSVYDGVDNTGKLLATIDTTAKAQTEDFEATFDVGLFVVTAASGGGATAAKLTVLWR